MIGTSPPKPAPSAKLRAAAQTASGSEAAPRLRREDARHRLPLRGRQLVGVRGLAARIAQLEILPFGRLPLVPHVRRFVGPRVGDLLVVPRYHVAVDPIVIAVERPGVPTYGDDGGASALPPIWGARRERRDRHEGNQGLHLPLNAHASLPAESVVSRVSR